MRFLLHCLDTTKCLPDVYHENLKIAGINEVLSFKETKYILYKNLTVFPFWISIIIIIIIII